jgi:hypothetical protein
MSNIDLKLDSPEGCSIQSTTLEANHILHVTAIDANNETSTASLDLDTFIGNVNGTLSLGHTGFSSAARNVTLSADGQNLDAELPDANGDYSTSSVSIQHALGFVDGQPSLLMAYGFPHSTAHANADTIAEADAQLQNQAQVVSPDHNITKVMTLSCPDHYEMGNPNAEWVKQNLGPYGSSNSGSSFALGVLYVGIVVTKEVVRCCIM